MKIDFDNMVFEFTLRENAANYSLPFKNGEYVYAMNLIRGIKIHHSLLAIDQYIEFAPKKEFLAYFDASVKKGFEPVPFSMDAYEPDGDIKDINLYKTKEGLYMHTDNVTALKKGFALTGVTPTLYLSNKKLHVHHIYKFGDLITMTMMPFTFQKRCDV